MPTDPDERDEDGFLLEDDDPYGEDFGSEFADPGGVSALRAGPRIYPCPTCKQPNKLSAKDVKLGYQCDACADRDEGGGYGRADY